MTKVQINLPDQLVQEAQNAGLLTPERLKRTLREQLKARKTDELFAAMDRMAAVDAPVMTPEAIQAEIDAYRTEIRRSAEF